MRVKIDWGSCEGNGACMFEAPEVFEVRDDDNLYLLQEEPPEELRSRVEAAAIACPKYAITIED
jgi:ferredoxin